MKLSIITINYNNADGLRKTVESVLNQTCLDFEYIIIDGASTDDSLNIIKKYSSKLSYWVSEPDGGIYNAMNKGIAQAHGEYCIFMNSGDCFYSSTTIEDVLPELDGTTVVIGGIVLGNGVKSACKSVTFSNIIRGGIAHQSSFIKTSFLRKYKYDESLKIASDWKFWIQVLIIDNESYKGIDTIISIFDLTGISTINTDICTEERRIILQSLVPQRIVEDYYNDMYEVDSCLYWQIRQSKHRKQFYTVILLLLKFISLFQKSSTWIKKYPLYLKDLY